MRSFQGAATARPCGRPARRARRLRRATKREHTAAGTRNAWSSQEGATTTSPTICTICVSCVAHAERPNAGTLRQARRTRGAPREQPPRQHRGDLRDLRIVCHPRRATKRKHITAGTKNARTPQGAAATMTPRRPARRASPAPSDQRVVHRPRRATSASCVAHAEQPARRASPALSDQTRAQQARRGHGATSIIIVL
jgi:hypothetical protein